MSYQVVDGNLTADVAIGAASEIEVLGNYDFTEIYAKGTFGSGTVTLNVSPAGGTEYYSGGTLTSAGSVKINTKAGDKIKVTLSGSTSPDIDYVVR